MIVVRPMAPRDVDAVSTLVERAFTAAVAPCYSQQGVETFEAYCSPEALRRRMAEGEQGFVAVSGGAVVGMATVRDHNRIAMLFIDPPYQRSGIGRRLIDEAAAHIRKSAVGADHVTLNASPNAKAAYERLGFVASGREQERSGIVFTPMQRSLTGSSRYDAIGQRYAALRREDPRLRERILGALGDARSVVNVGAGAGSYEPRDRHVVPVEPSDVMVAQRPLELSPAIRAQAHRLPLRDGAVHAAMTVLSVHHWDEHQEQGVRELRRVSSGPVVIVTCNPDVSSRMWLMADYLPEVAELDRRTMPSLTKLSTWLGGKTRVEVVPVHRDTCDWTLLSFWAHPERVLDEAARNATSGFARMPPQVVDRVVAAVRRDLENGAWDARHGHLRGLDEHDAGLRLVINVPS